jgi:C1A family cysteine protease
MKAAVLATLAVLASADIASGDRYHDAFTTFIKKYQKSYPIEEVFSRFSIFKANMQDIEEHNAAGHSWTKGVNEFTDLSPEEFKTNYLGYKPVDRDYARSLNTAPLSGVEVTAIDWELKGAVTPVKNQGQCGSCWAFSTTGAIEGATQIASGKLVSLSEQELVDCAGSSGNAGCNGGLMDNAFEWVIKNGGLCTEDAWPYVARKQMCFNLGNCAKNSPISSYKDVQVGSEVALGQALMQQPIAIAIEADQRSFQSYRSGVMDGVCGKNLDHGVLLVGQGTDSGKDYWKVKNSWGSSWGEAGYIRLVQGKDQCGLTQAASFPVV